MLSNYKTRRDLHMYQNTMKIYVCNLNLNRLSDNKILDKSQLKAVADDNKCY